MAEDANQLEPTSPTFVSSLAMLAVPTILLGALYFFSPNFIRPDKPLDHPLGGDYLQEYVGGRLLQDADQSASLYDQDVFRATQHDAEILGFEWDTNQFFPAVYPPFWYSVVSPLSTLEYLTAARIWLALMAIALGVSMLLLHRYAYVSPLLLGAMCFASPVIESLSSGQKGTLLLLIMTGCYLLLQRQRSLSSGVVFGLIAFKPHLGLPIGLAMLCAAKWLWVAGTLSTIAALSILSWLVWPELCRDYVTVCLGFGDYVQSSGYDLEKSYSLWSAWQLLIADPWLAKVLAMISTASVYLGSMWFLRKPLSKNEHQLPRIFSALVLVTIVTAPHLYGYDLTILMLPIGLLSREALDDSNGNRRWQNWLPVGLLLIVLFGHDQIADFAILSKIQLGVLALLGALGSTVCRR